MPQGQSRQRPEDAADDGAAARDAKQRALEALKNKAAPDPAEVAARLAAREAKEAAEAEKRAQRKAAIDAEKAAKEEARAQAAAEALMQQFPAIKRTKEKFGALPAGPVVVVLTADYTAQ